MKQETLKKANELTSLIQKLNSKIIDIKYAIEDMERNKSSFYCGSYNTKVCIEDEKVKGIIIAILEADFADKIKKAEQEFDNLKDE